MLTFTTIIILSSLGFEDIDLYFGLFATELLLTSEIIPTFDRAESRRRNTVAALMIAIFVGAIIKRIILLSASII